MRMQSLIRAVYPAQCVACDAQTADDHGLCGTCWGQSQFITGLTCCQCGTPLPGSEAATDIKCDDCMTIARPWARGAAALAYAGVGRRLVLQLKHSDRSDLAVAMAKWMERITAPLLHEDTVFIPVPLHWTRLVRRKYNQSALLAQNLARGMDRGVCVDALIRCKRTKPLEGHSRDARFAALDGAISANPKRSDLLAGRRVILVDDVMTTGATLAASAEAASAAGAIDVCIVTLARVVKDA